MNRFMEKVVIVTGAGSGIGEGVARRFAEEGAQVVLAGRTLDKLEKVQQSLPDPRAALCVQTDVARESDVIRMVERAVETFGRIDVLVNNAGIAVEGQVDEVGVDDWKSCFATDVDGTFYGIRHALPHLRKHKGSIINISSVSGLGGDWGMSVYNAAKGAVTNFTRALAMDLGREGIRVNAVCPSLTVSEMTQDMLDNDELMNKFMERIPLGRPAEPADIAAVVAFLASDDARFVTGVNLPVDGGLTASNGQPPQA